MDLEYLEAEIPKAISESLDGISRVSEIVNAMKEFSHPGAQSKTNIDLNHAIQTTLTVARNEWKYNAEMEVDLSANLPLVPCLPGEMNQVFLNLIVNAAHAIEEKFSGKGTGRIKIKTQQEGNWVIIRISDNGNGIPENIRNKIFDPFFTTKKVGKGSGQGLAIAHSVIVNKHQGELNFESEVGKGTTFIIKLPIAEKAV